MIRCFFHDRLFIALIHLLRYHGKKKNILLFVMLVFLIEFVFYKWRFCFLLYTYIQGNSELMKQTFILISFKVIYFFNVIGFMRKCFYKRTGKDWFLNHFLKKDVISISRMVVYGKAY